MDFENIQYISQYNFSDLTLNNKSNNNKLYFDIAIFNNEKITYIIEYDGIQHFENGHFHNCLLKTHQNDLIKNKYCFEHNIPIIRIPYSAEYTIDDLKLETTKFLLTPENEELYYLSHGYKEIDLNN